jgi:hypothetical protein
VPPLTPACTRADPDPIVEHQWEPGESGNPTGKGGGTHTKSEIKCLRIAQRVAGACGN